MFLEKLRKIPVLGPLFCFDIGCHKKALNKFLVLWAFAMSPVIVVAFFSLTDTSSENGIWSALISQFAWSEQFIYAASFISPLFYLMYERYKDAENEEGFRGKAKMTIKRVFDGYWLMTLIAFLGNL